MFGSGEGGRCVERDGGVSELCSEDAIFLCFENAGEDYVRPWILAMACASFKSLVI
jgi:hypothetical protein